MTALATRFAINGDAKCFAGEALTVELAFDTAGALVDLTGRTFVWTIYHANTRAELFTCAGEVVVNGTDRFVRFTVDGDTTEELFAKSRSYTRHEMAELVEAGRDIWVEGNFALTRSASTTMPGVIVPASAGSSTRYVFDYQTRRVTISPRGAPGIPIWQALGLTLDQYRADQVQAGADAGAAAGAVSGAAAGDAAGQVAGASAGATAGSSAGAAAGDAAGKDAGAVAGTAAGTSAGRDAGTTAGAAAGTAAGDASGKIAGAAAGTAAAQPAITLANTAAANADAKATFADTQGKYAKAQGDAIGDISNAVATSKAARDQAAASAASVSGSAATIAALDGAMHVDNAASPEAVEVARDDYGFVIDRVAADGTREIARANIRGYVSKVRATDDALERWFDDYGCVGRVVSLAGADSSGGSAVVAPVVPIAVTPDDPRLTFDGWSRLTERSAARFRPGRPAPQFFEAQQYFAPGARCAFATTADSVTFAVTFNGTVNGQASANFPGPFKASVLINGKYVGSITSTVKTTDADVQTATFAGLGSRLKTVELVWPNLRPMDLNSVTTSDNTLIALPSAHRTMINGGDSITCGQNATLAHLIWASLLPRSLALTAINHGYPSKQGHSSDGTRDGSMQASLTTYMIGTNDYLIGQPNQNVTLAQAADRVSAYLDAFWAAHKRSDSYLFLASPIFGATEGANPTWTKAQQRSEYQARVAAYNSANPARVDGWGRPRTIYVDGSTLLGADDLALLNDGIHPNDNGHAQIAARWKAIITPYLGSPA